MRKLLWIGDAACDSGFARCTHNTLEVLRQTWDVVVLGLNYRGEPHDFPYKIHPAHQPGGDVFGSRRIVEMIQNLEPDVVVIQNDPWNIPHYMNRVEDLTKAMEGKPWKRPVFIGTIAVDGENCKGTALNTLDHVLFWTEFAREQAQKGGLFKPSGVVPVGVDLDIYSPGDKLAARQELLGHVPHTHDGFWFLNVNRNQPRKRLDLTVEYFAEWMHSRQVQDAFLYMHVCPTGDVGINLDQLANYYKLKGHFILAEPDTYHGATEAQMAQTYRAADVNISTSIGEGWGMPAQEAMACGLPCLLPNHSAYSDWAKDAALLVPCSSRIVAWGGPNVIGQVPDKAAFIEGLDLLYSSAATRMKYRMTGEHCVNRSKYRWSNVGRAFAEEVEKAYAHREALACG